MLSAAATAYLLEADTARASRGGRPINLDAGAPARGALRHSRRAVGHKLRVLFIDYLGSTNTDNNLTDWLPATQDWFAGLDADSDHRACSPFLVLS